MRFSLIICTYERPQALGACLESLAALDYDLSSYEVIVVDDGSAADCSPILGPFAGRLDLTCLRLSHSGISPARNAGIASARGEYLAFIDDDFTVPPGYLRVAERFFRDHPDAEVLTFGVESCGDSPFRHVQTLYLELVLRSLPGESLEDGRVIRSDLISASRAAIFRRASLLAVGGFDETLTAGEDGDLSYRLRQRGIPVYLLPGFRVQHWERKGLAGFLRQRVQYARSLYEIRRLYPDRVPGPEWTLAECLKEVQRRFRAWIAISRSIGASRGFFLLWPLLLLFLLTHYLTLFWKRWAAVRAARRQSTRAHYDADLRRAPLRAAQPGGRRSMKRLLYGTLDWPAVTAPFSALFLALARLTARVLLRDERVLSVFARGSTGSRSFLPLFSDLDVAVVLKTAPEAPSLEELRRIRGRMRAARALNPFLKDWWQFWILESEWPLFERYWYVYDVVDWTLLGGKKLPRRLSTIDGRVCAATAWFQEFMWFQTAFSKWAGARDGPAWFATCMRKVAILRERLRFFLERGDGVIPLAAYADWKALYGAKKYDFWARRYDDRRPPELQLAECLLAVDADARRLSERFLRDGGPRADDVHAGAPVPISQDASLREGLRPPSPSGNPRLDGRGRNQEAFGGPGCEALADCPLVFEDRLGLTGVLEGPPGALRAEPNGSGLALMLRELRRLAESSGRPVFLYTADIFRWAALMEPRTVIVESPEARGQGLSSRTPALLAEQLVYRVLYLGSYLRLIAGLADVEERSRELFWSLLRIRALYDTGRLIRDPAALCDLSGDEKARELDAGGLPPLEEMFRRNSALLREVAAQVLRLTG